MSEEKRFTKVVCPRCGKTIPLHFLEIRGSLGYSLRCPDCKRVSEVEISEGLGSPEE